MKTFDYVIFSVLIVLTFVVGLLWIIKKGRFVKYTHKLTPKEETALTRRSIIAGVAFLTLSVVVAISMVAAHYNIRWLMIVCFSLTFALCVIFVVVTRIIYRRNR